jgi:hypothetical protein
VEYNDDQERGPAIPAGSSERHTDHDRVKEDTSLQDQDLPLLIGSGQVCVVIVSELQELRVHSRGLSRRPGRLFVSIPRAARADCSVGVMLGHVSVSEKVKQKGDKGCSEGNGGSSGFVGHVADTAVGEHDETVEEQVLKYTRTRARASARV